MTISNKPRVFISYGREDIGTARAVRKRLIELGAEPWLDENEIKAGKNWKRDITKAIKSCDFFVALLSKSSVTKRGHVQREIVEALEVLDTLPENSVFIIPCRINDCEPSHARLKDLQRVDLYPVFRRWIAAASIRSDIQ